MRIYLDSKAIAGAHDGLLVDLDGTVYRGSTAITGAADVLEKVGRRAVFLTNNASRSRDEVAAHMRTMGLTIDRDNVVTSARTAARLLGAELPCGSPILVIGTEAPAAETADVGLVPVRCQADSPAAVVQGHSSNTDWRILAEGALAIRDGAMWVACNVDATFPTERGLVPGNGACGRKAPRPIWCTTGSAGGASIPRRWSAIGWRRTSQVRRLPGFPACLC